MEIFLVLVIQKQKCVLASRTSPAPRLPVDLVGPRNELSNGGSPKRPLGLARRRYGSFCNSGCGAAAPCVTAPERLDVRRLRTKTEIDDRSPKIGQGARLQHARETAARSAEAAAQLEKGAKIR
jgi:hypothetical protein